MKPYPIKLFVVSCACFVLAAWGFFEWHDMVKSEHYAALASCSGLSPHWVCRYALDGEPPNLQKIKDLATVTLAGIFAIGALPMAWAFLMRRIADVADATRRRSE